VQSYEVSAVVKDYKGDILKNKLLIIIITFLLVFNLYSDIKNIYFITNYEKIRNGYRITINNDLTFDMHKTADSLEFPNIEDFPVVWLDTPYVRKDFFDIVQSGKLIDDEGLSLEIDNIIPSFQINNEQYYDVIFVGGLTIRNIKESRNVSEIFPLDSSDNPLYVVSDELRTTILQSISRHQRIPTSRQQRRQPIVRTVDPVIVSAISKESDDEIKITLNNEITINEIQFVRNRLTFPEIDGKPIITFNRQNVYRQIITAVVRNQTSIEGFEDLVITNVNIEMLNRGRLKAMATIQFNNTFEINNIRVFYSSEKYSVSFPSVQEGRRWRELGTFAFSLREKMIEAVKNEIEK
jgi:DNA-binding cell septation regulator SpoVG